MNEIKCMFCDKSLCTADKEINAICDKCLNALEKDEHRQSERLVRYKKLFSQCECKEKCQ